MLKRIDQCRACSSTAITEFFDLGEQPFANGLVKAPSMQQSRYPLSLSFCSQCNLVQLNHTAEPEELFSDYVWVTGTSSTARDYSVKFRDAVLAHANIDTDNGYVLELASNDGTFLKPFIGKGYKVLGVDPARNIVEQAVSDGVPTKCGFFGEALAEQIIAEQGRPAVVFARNVLPHVANLQDFVKGIECCTGNDTLVVIEVHHAKIILEQLHYDSIYHEHLCYFSVESIGNLLNSHNLYIHDIITSPISGGSLVLFIGKQSKKTNSSVQRYKDDEQAAGTNELASWQDFAERSYSHKALLLQWLEEQISRRNTIAGYGASARSSTLLNFCGIDSEYVSVIADQSPLKQGLFTPGTGIPIDSPEAVMDKNPDTILLLAWNFAREITDILHKRYRFEGELIVPLPYAPKTIGVGV